MQIFKDVNGNTVQYGLFDKGIMKQIGDLDCQVGEKGYHIFLDEIWKAHQEHSDLNHQPIDYSALITHIFEAGYLEGIRAERARKKKNR